jgi:hypothetical protein
VVVQLQAGQDVPLVLVQEREVHLGSQLDTALPVEAELADCWSSRKRTRQVDFFGLGHLGQRQQGTCRSQRCNDAALHLRCSVRAHRGLTSLLASHCAAVVSAPALGSRYSKENGMKKKISLVLAMVMALVPLAQASGQSAPDTMVAQLIAGYRVQAYEGWMHFQRIDGRWSHGRFRLNADRMLVFLEVDGVEDLLERGRALAAGQPVAVRSGNSSVTPM